MYIHDEWCEMRLGGSSECNCYVGVIRGLEARIEALEKQVRLDYRALKLVAMDSSPAKRLAFCEENNLMPQKGSDGKYPPCACTDDYWRAAIVGTAIDPRRSAVDLAALAAEEET